MQNQETKKRRLCLFAGYDKEQKIDDYVIYYIKELAQFSDVYYCADCEMSNEQLHKLSSITKGAFAYRHKEYDFGSWKYILNQIGWDKVSGYDEVLLVNDSCFGPLFPLKEVFAKMDSLALDVWSIAQNKFLMSFFVCIKASLFQHPRIKEFFQNIQSEDDKNLVIKKYERGFSQLLMALSPKIGGYLEKRDVKNYWQTQKKELSPVIRDKITWQEKFFIHIKGDRIRLYEDDILLLAQMRFPLVKKLAVMSGNLLSVKILISYLQDHSSYPTSLIENYQKRMHFHQPSCVDILAHRLKNFFKYFILETKYKKDVKIIRICKIPVYIKKLKLQ